MDLEPVVVELMQKASKEEMIEAVREILPRIEIDVQVELIGRLKRLTENRALSEG